MIEQHRLRITFRLFNIATTEETEPMPTQVNPKDSKQPRDRDRGDQPGVIVPVQMRRREHGPDACVHIAPAPAQDAVTLCNMTFAEPWQKMNTTNLPVDCPACLTLLKFCRSFRSR